MMELSAIRVTGCLLPHGACAGCVIAVDPDPEVKEICVATYTNVVRETGLERHVITIKYAEDSFRSRDEEVRGLIVERTKALRQNQQNSAAAMADRFR